MKKTLFLVAALCTAVAAVAQAETIQYDRTQTVTGDKTLTEDTTIEVAADATVTRTGNISGGAGVTLIKEGEGTLKARLNDSKDSNLFQGNVTVNDGMLVIYSNVGSQSSTTIGAGEKTAITVAKGATLQFNGDTGINVPAANVESHYANTVALRNSGKTTDAYGPSQLSNVKVTTNTIAAVDSSERGSVTVNEASLYDTDHVAPNTIKGVNLQTNEFSVSGAAVIDNATVRSAGTIHQPLLVDASIEVKNGSKVILDNETFKAKLDPEQDMHYGFLRNTKVDKTSYINAGDKDGKLMAAKDMTYMQLQKGNELHVAAKDKGGVAVREIRGDVKALQELEVVYITDQLSGCAVTTGSNLLVTLDETMPWDPSKYKDFTFTVVLKGLDSSAVVPVADDFVVLENSPVQLYVEDFAKRGITMDTQIAIRAFTDYGDNQGPATVFRFHLENVVPEPATATLSLLALAGLAARRRRR